MPFYMLQAAYTSEALGALAKSPQDRAPLIRSQLQKLGGRLISFHFSLGEYDTVTIYEAPDDTVAAAFAISVAAPGFLRAVRTTALMTSEQAIEAMRKAGAAPYAGLGTTG